MTAKEKGSGVYGFIDTAGQWVISGIAFLGSSHRNILAVLLVGGIAERQSGRGFHGKLCCV